MQHYMFRWQFNETSVKGLVAMPQDRSSAATTLVEGHGGKLLQYFFTLGEYDGVGIVQFPDLTSVTACVMTAMASGGFSRFETTALLTVQEGQAAMQKAHDTKPGYRSPAD